jgi:hypothetical protein
MRAVQFTPRIRLRPNDDGNLYITVDESWVNYSVVEYVVYPETGEADVVLSRLIEVVEEEAPPGEQKYSEEEISKAIEAAMKAAEANVAAPILEALLQPKRKGKKQQV